MCYRDTKLFSEWRIVFIVIAPSLICYLTSVLTCSFTLKFPRYNLIQDLASRSHLSEITSFQLGVDEASPLKGKMLSVSQDLGISQSAGTTHGLDQWLGTDLQEHQPYNGQSPWDHQFQKCTAIKYFCLDLPLCFTGLKYTDMWPHI